MKKGLWLGSLLFGIDQKLLRGKAPWTLRNRADHTTLRPAAECPKIDYPRPDGKLSFDRLSSVFLSNTNHEEDQPCHLRLEPQTSPFDDPTEFAEPLPCSVRRLAMTGLIPRSRSRRRCESES